MKKNSRYSGNGNAQMGMKLEGISKHDSGNWTLVVQPPNWNMISTVFEIIVTEKPHLTTEKDLPIRVQVYFMFNFNFYIDSGERKSGHCVRSCRL